MQKLNKIIFFLALFITSCGQNGDPQTEESTNLFLNSGNQMIEKELNNSLLGLWESEEYSTGDDGFTYQIRWEVTNLNTTLAKKCTDDEGRSWYSQVTVAYDPNIVVQFDLMDPYDIPVMENEAVSDVTLMTDNKPCRVALRSENAASQSLIASDTDEYDLTEDNFESNEMVLTVDGTPSQIKLVKIQNRSQSIVSAAINP